MQLLLRIIYIIIVRLLSHFHVLFVAKKTNKKRFSINYLYHPPEEGKLLNRVQDRHNGKRETFTSYIVTGSDRWSNKRLNRKLDHRLIEVMQHFVVNTEGTMSPLEIESALSLLIDSKSVLLFSSVVQMSTQVSVLFHHLFSQDRYGIHLTPTPSEI